MSTRTEAANIARRDAAKATAKQSKVANVKLELGKEPPKVVNSLIGSAAAISKSGK